jgi:hypothetical protein
LAFSCRLVAKALLARATAEMAARKVRRCIDGPLMMRRVSVSRGGAGNEGRGLVAEGDVGGVRLASA